MALKVYFSRSSKIGSYAIRWLTHSHWSHCALYDPETDTVIEATWPHGVVETPLHEFCMRAEEVAFREFDCDLQTADRALALARSQIGKPYDVRWIFGYLLHRPDWQSLLQWVCSELILWAFLGAGLVTYRPEALKIVAPDHLWIIDKTSGKRA
jgi:uncharacterized protein YycO